MPEEPEDKKSQVPDADAASSVQPAGEQKPVTPLTPEEQMERFEEALKETDWGHQPC